MVQVTSQQGEVEVRARVTGAVPPGMVAMAFHFAECPTNELISSRPDTLDPVTKTPAYKTCPVRIRKLEGVTSAGAMLEALHRASQDGDFRALLSRDPGEALRDYSLTDEEAAAIVSGDVDRIESHVARWTSVSSNGFWPRPSNGDRRCYSLTSSMLATSGSRVFSSTSRSTSWTLKVTVSESAAMPKATN